MTGKLLPKPGPGCFQSLAAALEVLAVEERVPHKSEALI